MKDPRDVKDFARSAAGTRRERRGGRVGAGGSPCQNPPVPWLRESRMRPPCAGGDDPVRGCMEHGRPPVIPSPSEHRPACRLSPPPPFHRAAEREDSLLTTYWVEST